MLLNNGNASSLRMQRRALGLFIVTGTLCLTAFLLSFQLPDIEEFKFGHEFRNDGSQSLQRLIARESKKFPAEEVLELYSLETAPFLNETISESRERMRAVAIRPEFIFVSISSYRDDNCIETLTQLFTRCRYCDRLRIGLVDQLHPDDQPCQLPDHLLAKYRTHVRTIRMDWKQARGPTFARYLTSRLWRGEQYLLQIDAHLNFIDEWDRRLLEMVPRMPSSRFVLSHYPVATVGELENVGNPVPFICNAKFDDYMKGLFSQDSGWYQIAEHDNVPQASPFIGAGFLFAPATALIDVPYDPYLDFLFHGEEFAHSARLWTSGYELVVPLENIASHVYGHRKNNAFVDNPESSLLAEHARDRVRYILGMSKDIPSRTEEIDDLGLGHSRSFEEYLDYTGLDLEQKQIRSHCNDLYDWKAKNWYSPQDPKPAPLVDPTSESSAEEFFV